MANPNYLSSNLGLPQLPTTEDQNLYNELFRVYNAINIVARNLDYYTGIIARPEEDWAALTPGDTLRVQNGTRVYLPYTETCTYGNMITIYDNAGVASVRKANATDATKPCFGFCSVGAGVTAGDIGEIMLLGLVSLSGATPGLLYYLSTTSGQLTSVKPTTSGNLVQALGFGITTTAVFMNPSLNNSVVP